MKSFADKKIMVANVRRKKMNKIDNSVFFLKLRTTRKFMFSFIVFVSCREWMYGWCNR